MAITPDLDDLRQALLSLTPAQQVAVEVLSAGGTHQAAAEVACVSRETVTRWAGHLPAFQATLNLYRAALVGDQIDTARRIRGKALSALEAGIDDGSVDPLAVLRVLSDIPVGVGPTVPEAILDAAMNETRVGLPPLPPPSGLDADIDMLLNPAPSPEERAERMTITRLASAAQLDLGSQGPE